MTNITHKDVSCSKHNIKYAANVAMIGSREIISPCPKCQEEADEKERLDHNDMQAQNKKRYIADLFKRSGIPPRYTTRNFENYHAENDLQKKALNTARKYLEIIKNGESGAGLIMSGNVGTGKTHLACAIADEYMKTGKCVLFITVSAVVRKIRETYNRNSDKTEQQAINEFRDVDLLIIDEIGLQKGTESEEHLIFEIINERYAYFKPTVLISNMNADEIKQYIGSRAMDRMREGGGKYIAFEWESYRDKVVNDERLPDADKAKY